MDRAESRETWEAIKRTNNSFSYVDISLNEDDLEFIPKPYKKRFEQDKKTGNYKASLLLMETAYLFFEMYGNAKSKYLKKVVDN